MKSKERPEWILLIHQIPPKPTNLRVRIWRKLQNLGSVLIKNSVYILPFNEKTKEDFQWLKQEIESEGGEATIFRADSVEGTADTEIISLFREQSNANYTKLTNDFAELGETIGEQRQSDNLSFAKFSQIESEFAKLQQELERIKANDFFQAGNYKKAQTAFEKCLKDLQSVRKKKEISSKNEAVSEKFNVSQFQNKIWVTRKDPHIDRLASGWLIKRFIDKRPRFRFVESGEKIGNAISFDMVGSDFTHQGEDCTFETLIKNFGLESDSALSNIAEIVHDIDLKDSKYNRLEAVGFNAVIRGISAVFTDDNERLKESFALFDGLYQLFSQQNNSKL